MTRLAIPAAVLLLLVQPTNAALLAPEISPQFAQQQADPATAHYAAGLEALSAGDTDAAETAFQAAVAANPRMPQPLVGLADVALRRGKRDEAKKWLDQAVAVAPQDDGVQHSLSVFHFTGKDYPAAETALKKAIDINPKNLRAQLDLADLYANSLKRPTDAIAAYRAAIAIDGKHAGAHHGLAAALAATGQFAEAETEFRKSAQLAPMLPVPLHSLARMQFGRGQIDAGMASLDAALKIQPTFVPALLDKGDMLLSQDQPDAALALYDQAVTADANSAPAHFKRGTVLQMQNKPAEAKQAYQKAIEHDAQFAAAYNNLAWLEVESSGTDLNQAAQWAATAVKLAPEVAAYRDTQGWVYRAQRQYAEAETVLEKAATMKPPVADIKYHLGVVYLEQRKLDQARRAFSEALAIDPKHAASKAAIQKLGDAS
jgi:tetratricopeptide (TPR) repeat protein